MPFPRPEFMRLALRLARRGKGRTSPNPAVGAVLVRGGRVVGKGYHRAAGMPHAEVMALRAAGKAARGADLYVTLEPCAHAGRTGPCTDAIIAAGVKRVAAAMRDPNPLVAGKGFRALRKAGISVDRTDGGGGPIPQPALLPLGGIRKTVRHAEAGRFAGRPDRRRLGRIPVDKRRGGAYDGPPDAIGGGCRPGRR